MDSITGNNLNLKASIVLFILVLQTLFMLVLSRLHTVSNFIMSLLRATHSWYYACKVPLKCLLYSTIIIKAYSVFVIFVRDSLIICETVIIQL